MAYPDNPFDLKLPSAYKCTTDGCKGRFIRETKDETSPWMGQLRCPVCGAITDIVTYRATAVQVRGK